MINYYEADCVYNPKYGKNTCSICKHINECILVLPKDKEYKYLSGMVKYYYDRRKEMQKSKRVEKYFLYSFDEKKEQEKYLKKKEFYDKIKATEPVYYNDGKYILIYVPRIKYVLVGATVKYRTADVIRAKKQHQNLKDLKKDKSVYSDFIRILKSFQIKEIDLIIEKLLQNLNNNITFHPKHIKDKLVYWSLAKYKPETPKEYKQRLKKQIKEIEKDIEEYDTQLRNFQIKKFKRDKILRKRIKKEIEEGVLV